MFWLRRVEGSSEFQHFWLWVVIGWALIVLVIYLSLTANPPEILEFAFADKLKHMLAYSVLMGWFGQLYSSAKHQLVWVAVFCLLGVMMEFGQDWGGQRTFDVADMLANSIGVVLAWWLVKNWLAGSLLRVDYVLSRWLGKA